MSQRTNVLTVIHHTSVTISTFMQPWTFFMSTTKPAWILFLLIFVLLMMLKSANIRMK